METFNYVMLCVKLFWRELAVAGAVMVSLVIAFLGLIKPAFKRIKNEELQKSAIAFSSILLSFCATAVYFAFRPVDRWDLYWIASLMTSAACILTYWLYEYVPYLRTGVHKLLHFIIDKTAHILNMIVDGKSAEEVKGEVKKATEELKATAKAELKLNPKKSTKKDKELENL